MRAQVLATLVVAGSLGGTLVGAWQGAKQAPAGKAETDYAAELPRIPPREPGEALKTFRTRPGFRVELVAAEPLVQSPVAADFDEDGRLYVVEYPEYNQYANKDFKGRGRVKRLEDTDGDGRYDRATVYVDNLDSPVAVACWKGGVFVGVVPDLLYCKDTDGDGRADVRRAVLTGFGRDAAGEAMLNSFRWGFDNRLHVSTSMAGGTIRHADKKDVPGVGIRSQNLVFDPRTETFTVTSGGGQHGMTRDDWGRTFVCSNSEPVHTLMYDGHYLARNPFVPAPAAAVNCAPEGKFTPIFRVSANEPWRVLRTRLRSQGIVPGSDEGGKPSGFFTGATGITAYRGDAWPESYRGNLFVGEVSGNLVYRARVEANGVGWTARRADPDVEFLASTDNWFRPVQFANAPDGTLYVIDMYRGLIEGAAFLPPQILRHVDVGAGIDRGRVYRIAPDGFRSPAPPRLSKATTAELVALLEHRNGWHRDTASRLLYERQDRAAVAPLKKLVETSTFPQARLHALFALDGLQALDPSLVLRGLRDPDARLREQALRLAEKFEGSPEIRAALEHLATDPELRVRYQLAFSLGAVTGELPGRLILPLAIRDGADPWFRLALLTSSHDRAGLVFEGLLADKTFRATAHGRTLLTTLAAMIGAANLAQDVAAVVRGVNQLTPGDKALAQDLVRNLVSKQPAALRSRFSGGSAAAILADLLREARLAAVADKRTPRDRAAAARTLGLAPFAEVRDLMKELLQLRQPQPVQAAVLETLARFDDPGVPTLVLGAWPGLSPQLRATAAETLFARPAWVTAFLDAVEQGKVGRGDVDPARVALLQASADPATRTRTAKLFAGTGLARRQEVVAAYQKSLQLKGDAARGKAVFKKECSSCHRLENVGESVGADLNGIKNQGPEVILLNILDPNREVKPQYLAYVLATDRGRTLTGMIAAETATSLTLRRADGTGETILRVQIEELKSTGMSFMPEGLEKQIDPQAMADLLAYLNAQP